jgi:hypothetical protein
MTPIEIIALIFAIVVLIKMLMLFVAADKWMDFAEKLAEKKNLMKIIYILLAALVGYYVLSAVNIVTAFAVIVFGSLLYGISLMPHMDHFVKLHQRMKPGQMLKTHWLSFVIWIALSVYVLYTLFL